MSSQSKIVSRLGEQLIFGSQILKASLKESTRATFSLANRDCYFEGQTFKGQPEIQVGDYFTRNCDMETYFIVTLQPEPQAPELFYMYASKCNTSITIKRLETSRNDYGELISDWQTIFTDVKCYKDVATRSDKMTNDGAIDQTIYTLILPDTYKISKEDRVVMKINDKGIEADMNYKVESIGNQVKGINVVQLTADVRD